MERGFSFEDNHSKEEMKYKIEERSDILPDETVCVIVADDDQDRQTSESSTTSPSIDTETNSSNLNTNPNNRYCFCPFDADTTDGPHVCKGEWDKDCELFMANLVESIFSLSDKIDQAACATFDEYCKYAAGRRHFAELLNQRRVRDKLVEEETFYRLVQFCAICLFECFEAEDFTPATTLMNMCFTFYHHDPKILTNGDIADVCDDVSFLYSHLREQHIWKSMRFWDVAFLTAMHQERSRWKNNFRPRLASADEVQAVEEMEENTTFGQLGTILHNMRELQIPLDKCLQFLEKTSAIGNLSQDHGEILLGILNPLDENKDPRRRTSQSNGNKMVKRVKSLFGTRKRASTK